MSALALCIGHGGDRPTRERVEAMLRRSVAGRSAVHWHVEGPAVLAACHPERPLWVDDALVLMLDGVVIALDDGATGPVGLERIAGAWRRWGIDAISRMQGSFVLAAWERGPGVLHVIRDDVGQRPLFWTRAPSAIALCSELPPLLTLPWVRHELARDHVAEYLAFRVVHAPRTLLRDVHQLEPGHRLRFSEEGVRVTRFAGTRYAAPGTAVPREADVVPELTAAIDRAVRRHIAGQEDVGVYLSGGVGSTAVTHAARGASRSLQTFTVTYNDEESPETPFAGRVANIFHMHHHTVTVSSKEIADHFDDTVAALGHPNGNVAAVLQLMLARAARGSVRRVITGDGADQLFGGQMLEEPAAALKRAERFHRLPGLLRELLSPALRRSARWADVVTAPGQYPLVNGVGGVVLCDARQRRQLLLDAGLVRPSVRQDVLAGYYQEVDTDPLNAVMHAYFRSQLVADILPRLQMTAAAAGLEVACPLLDPEVVRYAKLLPGGFKVRGYGGSASTRWLLRALLRGQLPQPLINRPDRPMARPLDAWLNGAGRLFLEERFSLLRKDPLELWHHTGIEALKRGLSVGSPGIAHRLWALFAFDAWIRQVGAT